MIVHSHKLHSKRYIHGKGYSHFKRRHYIKGKGIIDTISHAVHSMTGLIKPEMISAAKNLINSVTTTKDAMQDAHRAKKVAEILRDLKSINIKSVPRVEGMGFKLSH